MPGIGRAGRHGSDGQYRLEKKNTDFDEEEEVGILALRGCSVPLLDVVTGNVDTLSGIMC